MPEPNQESEIEADAILELSDAPSGRASETPPPPADNGKSASPAPGGKDTPGSNPPQPSRLSSLPLAPPRPGAPSANPLKSDRPSSPPRAPSVPRAPGLPSSSGHAAEKVDPLADLQAQLELARRSLAAKEAEVRGVVAQRDQGIAEIESLRHQLSSRELAVKELEFAAMTRDTRIRELEKALDQAIAQARDSGDDLTEIRGIGPAFARELKRLGVRTFEQVAAWTAADIEDIAPKIKARRERIYRETWMAKAAELAARRRKTE